MAERASSGAAWGCTRGTGTGGWVPYPREIPRRNPLVDAVSRTDDPCARPLYCPPNYKPMPAFKSPREGYPNNMCDLDDYNGQWKTKDDEDQDGSALATLTVAGRTPQAITLKMCPTFCDDDGSKQMPTLQQSCKEARNLDYFRQKHGQIFDSQCEPDVPVGANRNMNAELCGPGLKPYPCIGVIRPPRQVWKPMPTKCECPRNTSYLPESDLKAPVTGWEYIDGERTCDFYPIGANLPERFNHPAWFKGYGCENAKHPFYWTTSDDYGRFPPNPHSMTTSYHPKETQFTELLGRAGMYRNRTLNTCSFKSKV